MIKKIKNFTITNPHDSYLTFSVDDQFSFDLKTSASNGPQFTITKIYYDNEFENEKVIVALDHWDDLECVFYFDELLDAKKYQKF